jgi:hypothetical protein
MPAWSLRRSPVRGLAVPAGIRPHRRVHAPRDEEEIVIHFARRLAAVLVGAGAAALTLTALAGATHLQGFGHDNVVAADGFTSTSCNVSSQCLSVTNTAAVDFSAGVRAVGGASAFSIGVDSTVTGNGIAIKGATQVANDGWGVEGIGGESGLGVFGHTPPSDNLSYGVEGDTGSNAALGAGVFGFNNGASAVSAGVYGNANTGTGLLGIGGTIGVLGFTANPSGLAGLFIGNVHVQGTLSKSAGSFRIDHPLDPANKYLQHSFVESPDMKNVYDGVVTTNARGFATVTLPRYFEALNRSFRYQLTSLSGLQNVAVAKEIANNRFVVQSEKPGSRVSWQVTGIRKDRYANAHRIQPELAKPAAERGRYLSPELYGKPAALGLPERQVLARAAHVTAARRER